MKSVPVYRPWISALLLVLALVPLTGISSFEALLAPKPDLWAHWQAHDANSTLQVDHSAWDGILEQYLKPVPGGANLFDYAALKRDGPEELDAYLSTLARIPVSKLNRSEQMAYWINLYNALTIQTVVHAYPVESIRDIDISPGLFSDGPWGKPLIEVEGEAISLNDIEHRILRPIWKDPRVHYAVNCASVGCPDLAARAYRPAAMEEMLEAGARNYTNADRGVWWEGEKLGVSSIYVWFRQDFGAEDSAIIAHLQRYARPALGKHLAAFTRIHDHRYDWSLNQPN